MLALFICVSLFGIISPSSSRHSSSINKGDIIHRNTPTFQYFEVFLLLFENMAGGGSVARSEGRKYEGGVTAFVVIACLVAAMGGLMFGYDIGISGEPKDHLDAVKVVLMNISCVNFMAGWPVKFCRRGNLDGFISQTIFPPCVQETAWK